jgi:type III restriction enzyme
VSGARHVDAIAGRLSLRAPQRESLEILARVCELLPLSKATDLDGALAALRGEFPQVAGFDRDFPSLCFALATGVGKTRLMGAFIAWLHRARGVRNFFVLAPNLTIYEKLIRDFTPNSPKYVFTGLSEFATTPPEIVTGDNYEQGRGVRKGLLFDEGVHINVFNISKINSEVRGGNAPRIKRLAEYIGQSYFEYLSELPDLVMLMDESHRYRASAGVRAINELKPVLGLELTATPQIESARGAQAFGNVIYSYPLASALADGFVKEPAVATREDFDARDYDEAGLERLKLEDGIHIHEQTKVELKTYALNQGECLVKPFALVVAQDTEHASTLKALMESEGFFRGDYRGKVLTVHSNQRGEEKDEVVQQLLSVEDPVNPIEVVIHVNMLKEGWDVTNLYTIIPLRAANSRTLVEQSIGRGLRLPYGTRVGVDAVDRLTIVAHDRFQEIVDHANDPSSIIRHQVVIGRDVPGEPTRVDVVQPTLLSRLFGEPAGSAAPTAHARPVFESERQKAAANQVLALLPEFERLASSRDLLAPEVQRKLVESVRESLSPAQQDFTAEPLDLPAVVKATVETYVSLSIDIPRVTVTPRSEVRGRFELFELDLSDVQLRPGSNDILILNLAQNTRHTLSGGSGVIAEARPEDYLLRALMDFDDVAYDDQAEVLYALAEQVVARLRGYLPTEEAIAEVLQHQGRTLAGLMHGQMQNHYVEARVEYDVKVDRDFMTLRANAYTLGTGEGVRDFHAPVEDRSRIRQIVFGGFDKCIYPRQKFDSDPERRFAVLLEADRDVLKWLKPAEGRLPIFLRGGRSYLPDFVVEATTGLYLCEVKARNELESDDTLEKARAGALWCSRAGPHSVKHGGKPWRYLLIPDDATGAQRTFASLVREHEVERAS